jgi:hypothetical protein
LHGVAPQEALVTFKTALLAILAAAALIGAAIVGVPSTGQRSEPAQVTFRIG